LAKIESKVREHGIVVIITEKEIKPTPITASFRANLVKVVNMAYTVGLADAGLPELITFGLPGETATGILNDSSVHLKENRLPLNVKVNGLANLPLIFKHVHAHIAADYIRLANQHAGKHVPALQLVWSDPQGRFPWEPQYERGFLQPALYQQGH